jgi:hypothetical protein
MAALLCVGDTSHSPMASGSRTIRLMQMNRSGSSEPGDGDPMLKHMIDRIFESLLAAIIALGSAHTIASIYREKEKQRRWRQAVKRLRFGVSNASN